MKKISIVLGWCLACVLSAVPGAGAEELTVMFTGQTHAMLYQCNCPKRPDGGIARRATAVKQIRKNNPSALLLDAGRFFAGGLQDEFTQNAQLDMKRTEIQLKAMELMEFDAAAISDDEFNFGKEFLLNSVAATKVRFLSCNSTLPGVSPYCIKELNGVKIGIIGITTLAAMKKAEGVQFIEPKKALLETLKSLRKEGVDIVLLLSNLSEEESLRLAEDVGDIDVLILAGGPTQELFEKVGSLWVLRPSWQGRELGKAVFTIKDRVIEDAQVTSLRLSDELSDDKEISAMLPRCFSDVNCKKAGMVGTCQDGGSSKSQCMFTEAAKTALTVVTPKSCVTCHPETVVDSLKKVFTNLEVSYVYYPSAEAERFIRTFGFKGLPAYLFSKDIEGDKAFDAFSKNLAAEGNFYIMKPQASGLNYFLDRQKVEGKLDLFISFYNQDIAELLTVVKELNPKIHFLAIQRDEGFDALKGVSEVEDDLRAVCVQKHYPQQFWHYLECRAKNPESSWWDDCLTDCDVETIKTCAKTDEGKALLEENISLNKELGVMFGPTYLLENQEIFSSAGVPSKEELEKILKR